MPCDIECPGGCSYLPCLSCPHVWLGSGHGGYPESRQTRRVTRANVLIREKITKRSGKTSRRISHSLAFRWRHYSDGCRFHPILGLGEGEGEWIRPVPLVLALR